MVWGSGQALVCVSLAYPNTLYGHYYIRHRTNYNNLSLTLLPPRSPSPLILFRIYTRLNFLQFDRKSLYFSLSVSSSGYPRVSFQYVDFGFFSSVYLTVLYLTVTTVDYQGCYRQDGVAHASALAVPKVIDRSSEFYSSS
jgi:hypothetical protein